MPSEFDVCERIAGFPLVTIQKALTWVGVMDDRDDLKSVSTALGCGPRQAAGVLQELEHQGFVTRGAKRNQWSKTQKGHRLAFEWQPPRRFQPIIERDDKDSPTNQGLEDVPCLLFGSQDDEDVFAEARLHVLFWAEFEGDHLVEISVFEPDDYEDPDSSGSSSRSAYVTPAHARTLAAGLQKAADMAEAEIARRAKHPPKHSPPAREPRAEIIGAADRPTETAPPVATRTSKLRVDRDAKKRDREVMAATLAELRAARKKPERPKKR